MSGNWQENLYGGLIEPDRHPSAIYTSMITKPNTHLQLSEMLEPTFSIESDNRQTRHINPKKKRATSLHRQMQFMQ